MYSFINTCIKSLRNMVDEHLFPAYERWANDVISHLVADGKPASFDDYYIMRLSLWACIGVYGDEEYKEAYLKISKIVIDKTKNT